MHKTDDPNEQKMMSYNELLGLTLQLNGRLDMLWQRVLYSHAAIVGVMVFFSSVPDPMVVPRVLVFFFYTTNTLITFYAFRDTYGGVVAAVADLKALGSEAAPSHVSGWVLSQNYRRHARRRAVILGMVWLVLAYLLIFPLLFLD